MKNSNKALFVAGAVCLSAAANAAVGPYDAITTAVDWSTVGGAITGIAALKAVPSVISVGAKMVLRMIGR